ncbi:hypothetical protein [Nannocystis pusilla]
MAKAETEPSLRKMYARTAKAERARLTEASTPAGASKKPPTKKRAKKS